MKLTLAERRFKSGETRSKGFAFAEYTSQDEQIKVVAALDGKEIEGRVLAVKNAMERLAGADE